MGRVTYTRDGRMPRQVGAEHYRTYMLRQPSDQLVVASCEQVGCAHWRIGWDTIVDESTDLGQMQAGYIRSGQSERSYRELGRNGEGLTVFRFESHQRCFQDHETIPEVFAVRDGDHRGNPRGTRVRFHDRPDDWVEDFAENQIAIAQITERG